jgi:uncharacterized protein
MGPDDPAGLLKVCVAYSPCAGEVDEEQLLMQPSATVRDALMQSGVVRRHAEIDITAARIGVWGKLRGLDEAVRDRDRVEIYRPLQVDPKEARRLRYRKHRDRIKP